MISGATVEHSERMNDIPPAEHLDGKLLVAMPSMGDPRFDRSVIYICAHSADGAMGLIVNKPARDLSFRDLLEQMDIEAQAPLDEVAVHYGGPVEHGRGFVLHSRDYGSAEGTLAVDDDIAMTATLDVLEDIALGTGPKRSILALGYAGWGPGQLESEIRANGWLTTEGAADLVFAPNNASKWQAAMDQIGIDPRMLSAEGGTA